MNGRGRGNGNGGSSSSGRCVSFLKVVSEADRRQLADFERQRGGGSVKGTGSNTGRVALSGDNLPVNNRPAPQLGLGIGTTPAKTMAPGCFRPQSSGEIKNGPVSGVKLSANRPPRSGIGVSPPKTMQFFGPANRGEIKNGPCPPMSGPLATGRVSASSGEHSSAKNHPRLVIGNSPAQMSQQETLKLSQTYKNRVSGSVSKGTGNTSCGSASIPNPVSNTIGRAASGDHSSAKNRSRLAIRAPGQRPPLRPCEHLSSGENFSAPMADLDTGIISKETGEHLSAKCRRLTGIGDSPVELAEMGHWKPPKQGEIKINFAATRMPNRRSNTSDDLFGGISAVARDSSGDPLLATVGRVKVREGDNWLGLQLCALKAAVNVAKKLKDEGMHDGPVVYESELFLVNTVLKENNMGYPVEVLEASIPGDLEDVAALCETSDRDRFWELIDLDGFSEWIEKDKSRAGLAASVDQVQACVAPDADSGFALDHSNQQQDLLDGDEVTMLRGQSLQMIEQDKIRAGLAAPKNQIQARMASDAACGRAHDRSYQQDQLDDELLDLLDEDRLMAMRHRLLQ